MAWTAPRSWIPNEVLTAALLNTHLRDNLLELDVAKITDVGDYIVATGTNALTVRRYGYDRIDTSQTKTASTYGNLTTVGPTVTLSTGTSAILFFSGEMDSNVNNAHCKISYAVSGATTSAAADARSILRDGTFGGNPSSVGTVDFRTDLVAGTNTFTLQYASDGTNTATFANRFLCVLPL